MDHQLIIGKTYQLKKKLGSGAFGEIYLAYNTKDNKEYAVKLEERRCKYPQLSYEYKLYKYIHSKESMSTTFIGIPRVFYYNIEGQFNIMIMDLLGKSLEDLLQMCKGKFSVKTVLMLAPQMLSRIEKVHQRHFLHRDIKPDNFAMGVKNYKHKVYIFDFGLAKRYLQRDGKHIPYKEGKDLTGTARYASINTHAGLEQGRRDDLESLGYVLLYFLRGRLPWQSLPAKTKKQKYQKIMEKKQETKLDVLCKGFPEQFKHYIHYCRGVDFDRKPNYKHCKELFSQAMAAFDYVDDFKYDWLNIARQQQSKTYSKKPRDQLKNYMDEFDLPNSKPKLKPKPKSQNKQKNQPFNKIPQQKNPYQPTKRKEKYYRKQNNLYPTKQTDKSKGPRRKRKSKTRQITPNNKKYDGEGYTLQNLIDYNKSSKKIKAPKIVKLGRK